MKQFNNFHLRAALLLVLTFLGASAHAQLVFQNPALSQGIVSPAPMLPAEFNGTGQVSMNFANTGSTDIPFPPPANEFLEIRISLNRTVPDVSDPSDPVEAISAISGTAAGLFNWSYNPISRTFIGVQNQVLLAQSVGSIVIDVQVAENSFAPLNAVGFNANLQVPGYIEGNVTGDDQVSSVTFVEAIDFGDAPREYHTPETGDPTGPGHQINLRRDGNRYTNLVYLGQFVDAEAGPQPSANADGDDGDVTGAIGGPPTADGRASFFPGVDDEDGVVFPANMVAGQTYQVPVTVTVWDFDEFENPISVFLNFWVDWNRDGVFDNTIGNPEAIRRGFNVTTEVINPFIAAQQIDGWVGPQSFTIDVPVAVPADVAPGPVFARLRVGPNVAPLGPAGGISAYGEIEDHMFEIQGQPMDFGDAPVSYGTLLDNDGPRHVIGGPWMPDIANPLGSPGENDTDAEPDGQPSDFADGDDLDGNDDELGVFLPDFRTLDNTVSAVECDGVAMENDPTTGNAEYCATVRVANPTGETAFLAAWLDFGGTGNFDGLIDRSNPLIRKGASGLDDFGGNCEDSGLAAGANLSAGDWGIPANCEGFVVVVWPYNGDNDTITENATFARFRISTDVDWGADPSPLGELPDGEVEDHFLEAGTIPVSVHAFESEFTADGLVIRWSTASETHNKGFYVWGYMAASRQLELLTPQMIESSASDIVEPHSYSVTIPRLTARDVGELVLTAVDYFGNEEMYGYFSAGAAYGELNPPDSIDWASIRQEAERNLARSGLVDRGVWRAASLDRGQSAIAADFLVSQPGMQRISFEDLQLAGLDLSGVDPSHIAVTVKGQGVPRLVETPAAQPSFFARSSGPAQFGPGASILFWGEKPEQPKAKFVEHLVYRIEVNRSQVIEFGSHDRPVTQTSNLAFTSQRRADDVAYNFSNPSADPWHMAELRSWQQNRSRFDAKFVLAEALDASHPARVQVDISGLTKHPQGSDHRIRVLVNGTQVGERVFSGRSVESIVLEFPVSLLQIGENTVRVQSVGTAGINSITLLDSVELSWAITPSVAEGPVKLRPILAFGQDGVVLDGAGVVSEVVAFARTPSGVYRLPVDTMSRDLASVALPSGTEMLWASAPDQLRVPQPLGAVAEHDLMANLGNLLVITHPAFLPADPSESHPLNAFAEYRRAQGWNVAVINISDIQLQYGGGMALPQALPRFLADAARHLRAYPHVLLVGGDSYDYRDVLGQGSLSFIPTKYAATQWVPHTPSDALLADLNGDGLSDLPLGRWPVRTLADLQAHVDKVVDWEMNLAGNWSAAWVTDERDPGLAPFRSQVERLSDLMVEGGLMSSSIDQIIFEEAGSASAARAELFSALEQGRTFTGFSGHGSPTIWSFQGILRPSDVANLNNHGVPTLVGTMACYTTYFSSPFSNTLAHRLMNGLGADGESADRNGAVAIHGAATLSSMTHNEAFMRDVLVEQMAGRTLGEAIQIARANAARRGHGDLVINWTLLGDPTLQLQFSRGR